ncbi:MAG: hypothetical protein ACE5EG_03310 [Thermoanaerobaculia bacterium]
MHRFCRVTNLLADCHQYLAGAFNAMARYLGRFIGVNLSSNAYLERLRRAAAPTP